MIIAFGHTLQLYYGKIWQINYGFCTVHYSYIWQDLKCWLWSLYNTLQVYIGKIWKFLLWPLCHTLKLYCCQIWKTLAFQPAITATCIMWQYVKGRINWLWHPLWALHGIYMARCARKHVHDMHVIHVEPWNNNTVCVLRPCVVFVCVCVSSRR